MRIMLTNNQLKDIIQPMIVRNALSTKLKGETPMTDTMMIRDCIRSQGMKLGHVAHVLGITNNTLRCKLENESEFKVSEAEKLSKMLGMTVEQRDRCFFGPAG